MSWHVSYDSREAFENDHPTHAEPTADDGVLAQRDVAHAAAHLILDSYSVGGDADDFTVHLSGHSNRGHRPTPGMAYDCITVTVAQKSARPSSG